MHYIRFILSVVLCVYELSGFFVRRIISYRYSFLVCNYFLITTRKAAARKVTMEGNDTGGESVRTLKKHKRGCSAQKLTIKHGMQSPD